MQSIEQMEAIRDYLDDTGAEWGCRFYTTRKIGRRVYTIEIEGSAEYVKVTALFPDLRGKEYVNDCLTEIDRINGEIELGKFHFDDERSRPALSLYGMRRSENEVLGKDALETMTRHAEQLLERYAERLIARWKRIGAMEWLLNSIGFVNDEEDATDPDQP